MTSPVRDRFRAWTRAEGSAAPLRRFRILFGGIWLAYDVLDLWTLGTAHLYDWLDPGVPRGLVALQVGLAGCELLLVLGAPSGWLSLALIAAAALRAIEWNRYLALNDFAYFIVTAVILAAGPGAGGLLTSPREVKTSLRWPADVLVWQAAWIYFATGLLKLNPAWLSGRHLFVRLNYLALTQAWPYPTLARSCLESLPCDAALATLGVAGELSLALLLAFYPRRRVVLPLAVAIHGFGALATNVWFFGASLVAQVAWLSEPRSPRGRSA